MAENGELREQLPGLNGEKIAAAREGLYHIKEENLSSHMNVEMEYIYSNIRHSIRLGFPQVTLHAQSPYKLCIVGGGPSLEDTAEELLEQVWSGYKVIALNNAYNWLIDNKIRPTAVVMADSRDFMARFVERAVPDCKYFIASQCAPEVFAKVMDRETYIWHSCNDETEVKILDEFYLGHNYHPVAGGSTVALRAIGLMRMLGNRYMDLYGIDSCCMNGKHHAYEQPENDGEEMKSLVYAGETFICESWMVNQYRNFMDFLARDGNKFFLNVHGDGLLAYAIKVNAQVYLDELDQQDKGD